MQYIKIVSGEIPNKIIAAAAAWKHPVMQFDHNQAKPVEPFAFGFEQCLFASLNIDFENKRKRIVASFFN